MGASGTAGARAAWLCLLVAAGLTGCGGRASVSGSAAAACALEVQLGGTFYREGSRLPVPTSDVDRAHPLPGVVAPCVDTSPATAGVPTSDLAVLPIRGVDAAVAVAVTPPGAGSDAFVVFEPGRWDEPASRCAAGATSGEAYVACLRGRG